MEAGAQELLTVSNILSTLDPLLLFATWCAFIRGRSYKEFPAFCAYLSYRVATYAALSALLAAARFHQFDKHLVYAAYYFVYWVSYVVGAGITFFVIREIFISFIKPFPGLSRLGMLAFRWVTLISVLVALTLAIFPVGLHRNAYLTATSGAIRCMSVLELCLLAFIVVSMQTLQLPVRSRCFCMAMGLGMIASSELFGAAYAFRSPTLASVANLCTEVVATLAALLWAVCFFSAARERKSVAVRPVLTAPLSRWNEIARELGQPSASLAASQSSDFFLQDVERAVDKVLKQNRMNTAG